MAPHSSTLAWKIPWMEEPGRLQSMESLRDRTRLSNFTFTFHFHALEKEMATHSSVLAWRIPGMGEPGGLQSMGSHRVGHDWSDLAAAAAAAYASILLPSRSNGWLTLVVLNDSEWQLTQIPSYSESKHSFIQSIYFFNFTQLKESQCKNLFKQIFVTVRIWKWLP